MEKRRREDGPLKAPNAEGNVWPGQCCPAFEARANAPVGLRQCWYCRCSDFHLDKPKALLLAQNSRLKEREEKNLSIPRCCVCS